MLNRQQKRRPLTFSRIPLSQSVTGKKWLSQFKTADDLTAAGALLDALVLLNDTEVADAIRDGVDYLVREWEGRGRHLALYAEREFDTATAYESADIPDSNGRIRKRAVRYSGAVRPTRGKMRVGSEGTVAHLISQLVEKWPNVLKNNPQPKGIRAKSSPVGAIVIVTDIIGSGTRVNRMIDKFWGVPSVKSWVSRKWVEFIVVAAAGTREGIARVERHRLTPTVIVEYAVPTIQRWNDQALAKQWLHLIGAYGPQTGRGGGERVGYGNTSALLALSSRIPNNTPALLHQSDGRNWNALYDGAAPADLRQHFRIRDDSETVKSAASSIGLQLAADLAPEDSKLIVILGLPTSLLRHRKTELIAEATGMPRSQIEAMINRAIDNGLLTANWRLTDAGHRALKAGQAGDRRRPTIATNAEPYYPQQLRFPRSRI